MFREHWSQPQPEELRLLEITAEKWDLLKFEASRATSRTPTSRCLPLHTPSAVVPRPIAKAGGVLFHANSRGNSRAIRRLLTRFPLSSSKTLPGFRILAAGERPCQPSDVRLDEVNARRRGLQQGKVADARVRQSE